MKSADVRQGVRGSTQAPFNQQPVTHSPGRGGVKREGREDNYRTGPAWEHRVTFNPQRGDEPEGGDEPEVPQSIHPELRRRLRHGSDASS